MIDSVQTPDGVPLHTRHWPVAGARAVVVVAHGMAEHIGRYEGFAAAMNSASYAVVGHDQRGHGQTAGSPEALGFVAETDSWQHLVDDVGTIADAAAAEYPELPLILLGHSMGSLVARSVVQGDDRFAALVLSGTPADPGALRLAGQAIAAAELRARGPRARSPLLNQLTFGGYNKAIAQPRTEFDWLSRDEDVVDAYLADPACGWVGTTSFFVGLLAGLQRANAAARIARTPADLPVFFLSGDEDPVGGRFGAGATAAARAMRRRVRQVDLRLYAGARHELFLETNAEEVLVDVIRWCDTQIRP